MDAVDKVDEKAAVEKKAAKEPSAVDLLRQAAEALDGERGMRAKSYGIAAGRVREIVAWLESLE